MSSILKSLRYILVTKKHVLELRINVEEQQFVQILSCAFESKKPVLEMSVVVLLMWVIDQLIVISHVLRRFGFNSVAQMASGRSMRLPIDLF